MPSKFTDKHWYSFSELTYRCHLMRAGYLLLASFLHFTYSGQWLRFLKTIWASCFFLYWNAFFPLQLEAGIRSGDIESFKFIERAWKLISPTAAKEKDDHHGNKRGSIGMVQCNDLYMLASWNFCSFILISDVLCHLVQGDRHNRRIPTAHESRERLRNSEIFKRKLDDPNDEKQKKWDWNWCSKAPFLLHLPESTENGIGGCNEFVGSHAATGETEMEL